MQQKTDREWNQIRFQNSLGPQIGGLIKQAVDLTIAFPPCKNMKAEKDLDNVEKDIKYWLDLLYEIVENKKSKITEVKPLNTEKAVKLGDKFNKRMEEANKNIQETVEEGRQREVEDKLIQQP